MRTTASRLIATCVFSFMACSPESSSTSSSTSSSDAGAGGASPMGGGSGQGGEPVTPGPFGGAAIVEAELTFAPADWAALQATPEAEAVYQVGLDWDGTKLEQVALDVRGSGSVLTVAAAGSNRFNFKLDVNDTLTEQTLLGEKKLYLNHNFKDPTRMREILAYDLMKQLGVPAPRATLVHLKVNGESLGLYTAVEAVDGGFLEEHFADPDGELYQLDAPAGTLLPSDQYPGLEIERGEPAVPAPAYFLALVEALSMPDEARLSAVLEIDSALRFLAANVALVNLDSYLGDGTNYFLYAQAGVFTAIPWDVGGSFGLNTCGCPAQTLLDFPVDEPTCEALADRPLVVALLGVAALRERYHDHLRTAANALEALAPKVEAYAATLRAEHLDDPSPFFSAEDFEWALTQDLARRDDPDRAPIFGLTRFMAVRAASLRAQLDDPTLAVRDGLGACPDAPEAPDEDAAADE